MASAEDAGARGVPFLRRPGLWPNASQRSGLLIDYFRSGWAFLIPYLIFYLLYAWRNWPVNQAPAESPSAGPLAWSWVPCLLHVYWALHVLHLSLCATALHSWWRGLAHNHQLPTSTGALSARPPSALLSSFSSPISDLRPVSHSFSVGGSPISRAVYTALPWLCLALLFYIPGIYMEYPADPWAHYARVNAWSHILHIKEYHPLYKSSYFLAYSLTGNITPPLNQLQWFSVYYTVSCLLLCWQYYRLALVAGFSKSTAMAFVILQMLIMGNNIFGFYRYYGMSSSIFAQLGAVALTRIALEFAQNPPRSLREFFRFPFSTAAAARNPTSSPAALLRDEPHRSPLDLRTPLVAQQATTESRPSELRTSNSNLRFLTSASCLAPTLSSLIIPALCLIALTAFNHVQGIGIAVMGCAAVLTWFVFQQGWHIRSIFLAIIITMNFLVWAYWPRNPAIANYYQPEGWLSAWLGFNLLDMTSPAFGRFIQITGVFGALNLLAGLVLIKRKHPAGWLTVVPVILLFSPMFSLPFANSLAGTYRGPEYILVFHRLLFAIPAGLALTLLISDLSHSRLFNRLRHVAPIVLIPAIMLTGLIIPSPNPFYNRFWSTFMVAPLDLSLNHILIISNHLTPLRGKGTILNSSRGIGYALFACNQDRPLEYYHNRAIYHPPLIPSEDFKLFTDRLALQAQQNKKSLIFLPSPYELHSSHSQAAILSGHWPVQQVALSYAGASELLQTAKTHDSSSVTVLAYEHDSN